MNIVETLDYELTKPNGVLDKVDYKKLRRVGYLLNQRPHFPTADWDVPPVMLKAWVESYGAAVDTLKMTSETGLLALLQAHREEIRGILSLEIIPQLDTNIISVDDLEKLISLAKSADLVGTMNLESLLAEAPSKADLGHRIVVDLYDPGKWIDRPKVSEQVGLKRLEIAAEITQGAIGGLLTCANLGLGAVAGIISAVPAVAPVSVPLALSIIGSTCTGLTAIASCFGKLASLMRT